MVFNSDQLQQRIANYLTAVRQSYTVQQAILYGSYARGEQRDDSDIDLIVISPDFRGVPKLERHQKLGQIAWRARTTYIEPLGFTPEEYENASPLGLLAEVRDTGIVVYDAQTSHVVQETSTPYQTSSLKTPAMKIVIPLAGFGTRMRPHTWTRPKPLVPVAGKAVLGHVLDMFQALPGDHEFIFIYGWLGGQIEKYVQANYPNLKARYIEQVNQNGQSSAIYLAKDYLEGPMLMVFVDTLIETDLTQLPNEPLEAVAWVKAVPDPRRFGVAEIGTDGRVKRLIEKPATMDNNLAVVGFYYFKEARQLITAIEEQMARNIQLKGEYFLADAVNLMLARGLTMRVEQVEVWEDCGTPDYILHTNRYLLGTGRDNTAQAQRPGVVLVPPVFIDSTAQVTNSVIGPNASIGVGATISNSIVRDSIISDDAQVSDALLDQSLVGARAAVRGHFTALNISDDSTFGAQ